MSTQPQLEAKWKSSASSRSARRKNSSLRDRSVEPCQGALLGALAADLALPYPQLSAEERPKVAAALSELRAFCDAHLDPAANDRQADIRVPSSTGWPTWASSG